MNQVYRELKDEGIEFPTNVPSPKRVAKSEKDKEEEDFQLALAMSLSDQAKVNTNVQPTPTKKSERKAVFKVRALYDFDPTDSGELELKKGDVISVHDNTTYPDWWKGANGDKVGIFPANYVEKIVETETGSFTGKSIEMDEDEYLLKNLQAVRSLRSQIAEADPLGHDSSENNRIQVNSILNRRNTKKL